MKERELFSNLYKLALGLNVILEYNGITFLGLLMSETPRHLSELIP